MVLRDGAWLALSGAAVGLPPALLVWLALRAVFVDVGGFDGVALAAATVLLVVATLAAAAVPARRATRVQPMSALRTDP